MHREDPIAVDISSWIVFIGLLLIYGITLGWARLRPGERYGNYAYITALLPANFAWYEVMETYGLGNGFNGLGQPPSLVTLRLLAFIRDIVAVHAKKKDFDDAILYLLCGILCQLIAYGILPFKGLFPVLNDNGTGATAIYWVYWIMPNIELAALHSRRSPLVSHCGDRVGVLRHCAHHRRSEGGALPTRGSLSSSSSSSRCPLLLC